jgi:hypothetical protein
MLLINFINVSSHFFIFISTPFIFTVFQDG